MTFTLYNTITKQNEPFLPNDPEKVTFYSCGPTVYDDAHIGNFRSFLAADLLRRWIESPLCTLTNQDGTEHQGPRRVVHVMNITDVGHMTDDENADGGGQDKMELAAQRLNESKKQGKIHEGADIDPSDPRQIAQFYENRFKADAIKLGLKVAVEAQKNSTLMPRASDHVEHMKQIISELLNTGAAYVGGEPGSRAIYFNTAKFPDYGKLSGNTLTQLKGGAGGRVDDAQQSEKNHPADFLLWKEDKTHTMRWDAPEHTLCEGWDEGYPGWHIECSAMALDRLVEGGLEAARAKRASIDLHSGGEDNIFPHHECEIAQSCCFTGSPKFANHWFHARFLKVEGEKMSKSKGTMYTLSDLIEKGIDPAAVRLELIKTHYRANADFSMQGLKDSARRINKWRMMAHDLHFTHETDPHYVNDHRLDGAIDEVKRALSDDLSVSGVLAALDKGAAGFSGFAPAEELAKAHTNELHKTQIPTEPWSFDQALKATKSTKQYLRQLGSLHLIDNILGVIFRPLPIKQDTGIALYQPGVTPSEEIESLLAQRAVAKKSKDFATADAIRDQLAAMNLSIMDKPGGKVEVAPVN